MLRNIVLLFILTVALAAKCPNHCTCKENFATCNTTYFPSFEERILKLKITNPKVPLILKNGNFNVTGLQDVDTISIGYATILDLDDTAFLGIPKLTSFSIANSNIPRINNPLTFNKSEKLRIFQVTNSTLKKIDSFKSKSLEELDLSGNSLTAITKTNFEFLPSLTFINLENNRISSVDPLSFSTLLNLQDVLLSNNNITYLDPNTFQKNTELVSINLSKNPIKEIRLSLSSDLEKLVLKSCQLRSFGEGLAKNLLLLSYLDLSYNNINFETNSFNIMEELEFINLSNNNLTTLPSRIFYYNDKLQKIILDNNRFSEFPKLESRRHFHTYYFSCNNCSISKLAVDAFKYFSSVATLKLSNNRLTGADLIVLGSLRNLVDLNLSRNKIAVLDQSSFKDSSALKTVDLSGNPLKVINPHVFYFNRVLQNLDVSNCGLEKLWQEPVERNLDSLHELNLANNSLTSVSPRDLEVIPFVKTLGISSNLLHCDKVLGDTISWLTKHEVLPLSVMTKTHENIAMPNSTQMISKKLTWRFLTKERCLDEFYFDNSDEEEEKNVIPLAEDVKTSKKEEKDATIDIDKDYENYFYDDDYSKTDDDYIRAKELYESIRYKTENHTKYSFLWPTMVFIFTALSVLVIAANVLLLILRSRAIPGHVNLPHIKIPRWNTNNRLKKYSGSVYQSLSEEKTEMYVPSKKITVPTHSSPKTSV